MKKLICSLIVFIFFPQFVFSMQNVDSLRTKHILFLKLVEKKQGKTSTSDKENEIFDKILEIPRNLPEKRLRQKVEEILKEIENLK